MRFDKINSRPIDEVIVGNWFNESAYPIPKEKKFDVIIVDYVLGAVDWNFQHLLLETLKPHLKRFTGKIYFIGQEPYVLNSESFARYEQALGNFVQDIILSTFRVRDSCMLLSGKQFYHEVGGEFVLKMFNKSGFVIDSQRLFPIVWGREAVEAQLNICLSNLEKREGQIWTDRQQWMVESGFADATRKLIRSLKQKMGSYEEFNMFGSCFGMDYVISAHLE